ncbi:MAG: PDZ domain-containing protein [Candidatus Methylacidiphilales bacterium]
MKRSAYILVLFVGLNALVFWITSWQTPSSPGKGVPKREESTPSLLVPTEAVKPSRSILAGRMPVYLEQLSEDRQQSVSQVLPSIAQLVISWRNPDETWKESRVTTVCIDPAGYYIAPWVEVSKGEVFRLRLGHLREEECHLEGFDPVSGIAMLKSAGQAGTAVSLGNGLAGAFGMPLMSIWMDSNGRPRASSGMLDGIVYRSDRAFKNAALGFVSADFPGESNRLGSVAINMSGQVVGMRLAEDDQQHGLLLASELIGIVATQLRVQGFVSRVELGFAVQTWASELNPWWDKIDLTSGLVVNTVLDQGAGHRGGLREGDVIVGLDGQAVQQPEYFYYLAGGKPRDKALELDVFRQGERLRIVVEPDWVGSPDGSSRFDDSQGAKVDEPGHVIDGFTFLVEATEPGSWRWMVKSIDPGKVICLPQLQPGDEVIQINDLELGSHSAWPEGWYQSSPSQRALFRVNRQGQLFWSAARGRVR